MEDEWAIDSWARGLIPPEDEARRQFGWCGCQGHKVETASALELEFAQRQHRWKEFNEQEKDFLKAVGGLLTQYEMDILKLFGLPDLDKVRMHMDGSDVEEGKPFIFDEAKMTGLRRIFSEWTRALIGDLAKETPSSVPFSTPIGRQLANRRLGNWEIGDNDIGIRLKHWEGWSDPSFAFDTIFKALAGGLPLYQFHMLSMFGTGLKKTLDQIIKTLRDDLRRQGYNEDIINERVNYIIQNSLLPQLENEFLNAIIRAGGERIRTELGRENLKKIRRALIEMADTGKSTWDVARYLHREIGEGKFWYWHRIVRSELALAVNAAFSVQAQQTGVKYEQWSAAPTACVICEAFDGRVWLLGEGPEPVSSTHPYCLCIRVPLYNWENFVQQPYSRNPYESPYGGEELQTLGDLLNSQRIG